MIGLKNIEHIYLYPGKTDFRLGMYGLRKLIGEPKPHCLYVFASKSMSAIKVIETEEHACWLYQKKLFKGKFQYPAEGGESELTKEEISYIIEGVSLVARIESKGKKTNYSYY
jgi:transposase